MGTLIKKAENDIVIDEAIKLAEEVFDVYEAPDYGEDGAREFREFLYGENLKRMRENGDIVFWCAYCEDTLAGMCALRNGSHISLLFVHGDFHRQGIGRMLMDTACGVAYKEKNARNITVNSSPYGLPFYKNYGFIATDMERIEGGIRYTPMILLKRTD